MACSLSLSCALTFVAYVGDTLSPGCRASDCCTVSELKVYGLSPAKRFFWRHGGTGGKWGFIIIDVPSQIFTAILVAAYRVVVIKLIPKDKVGRYHRL